MNQEQVAQAQAAVDELGALTSADAAKIAEVKAAIPELVAAVEAGAEVEHKHTGVLNATAARVGDKVIVRVNATTRSGRSKMRSF